MIVSYTNTTHEPLNGPLGACTQDFLVLEKHYDRVVIVAINDMTIYILLHLYMLFFFASIQ